VSARASACHTESRLIMCETLFGDPKFKRSIHGRRKGGLGPPGIGKFGIFLLNF